MIVQVFAVRDQKADAFHQPFCAQSVGIALRSFTDEVNRGEKGNVMNEHPEDFSLYHLGSYDDQFARYKLFDNPVQILVASDAVVRG